MCNLAYIGATFLNCCLCLGRIDICQPSQPKIQNCGGNVGYITNTTPLIREFYRNVDSNTEGSTQKLKK